MAEKKAKKQAAKAASKSSTKTKSPPANYPRHPVDKSLRIPRAILEQNAGKECTVKESAAFLVGAAGPYTVEVASGIKYGFLSRPSAGKIAVTDRAKRVIRPQEPQDELNGLREAVLAAPVFADVYGHYRVRIFLTRSSSRTRSSTSLRYLLTRLRSSSMSFFHLSELPVC